MGNIRSKVFAVLNSQGAQGRTVGTLLLVCIGISVTSVVLESVESVRSAYGGLFDLLNGAVVAVFLVEYILRIWTSVEMPKYAHPLTGRIRYAVSPLMIIDALAIAPAFLVGIGFDLRSMRLFRTIRLFRVLKVARYVRALDTIRHVLVIKRDQLGMAIGIVLFLLLVTSSLMYELEHEAQPGSFSSIPATMWWAVASLTTVGYGDIYPITPLGKMLAGISAVLGVGLVALPAGILASGFSEQSDASASSACPHCGKTAGEQGG